MHTPYSKFLIVPPNSFFLECHKTLRDHKIEVPRRTLLGTSGQLYEPPSYAVTRKRLFPHLEFKDTRRENNLRNRSSIDATYQAVLSPTEPPPEPSAATVSRIIPLDSTAAQANDEMEVHVNEALENEANEEEEEEPLESDIDVQPTYSTPLPASPPVNDDSNAADFNFGDA